MNNICISGYYGFNNFGDETILSILVDNLKLIDSNIKITVFSKNPNQTKEIYKVESVQTFNLFKVIKTIFESDCLISGGGSLFQDVTSCKSLIYYLSVLLFAIIFRKKIIIFAQGIGHINNKILADITKFLFKKINLITVRDKNSYELLNKWGINSIICPDPVWNLNITDTNKKTDKIGIQLRDYQGLSSEFINKFALSVNKYFSDKEILLLSLQNNIDLKVCTKFKEKLLEINPHLKVFVIENTSNKKVIEDISELDSLIAMRYHACLCAIKSKVKLLPINYDIKVENLAKAFSLNTINFDKNEDLDEIIKNFVNDNIEYKSCDNLKFDFKLIENFLLTK